MIKIKKDIVDKLSKIKKVAEQTGMQGRIELRYSNIPLSRWEKIIDSLTDYNHNRHMVFLTDHVSVLLILD